MGKFSDVLLTVDYDRTLTAPDSSIPERNLEAIRYFMENDGAFTVNTGRSVPMIRAFRDRVPVNAPLLLYTPCVAAIATVKRELGSARAAAATVLIQCAIAWVMAFLVRSVGLLFGLA